MRTRYGTSFLLGYIVVWAFTALGDCLRGIFQLLGMIFGFLVKSADFSRGESFERELRAQIDPYLPVLVAKRAKLLHTDEYGIVQNERWSKELGYFIGKVLIPNLGSNASYVRRNLPRVGILLDNMIAAEQPMPVDN
jgi:hypothetical protein